MGVTNIIGRCVINKIHLSDLYESLTVNMEFTLETMVKLLACQHSMYAGHYCEVDFLQQINLIKLVPNTHEISVHVNEFVTCLRL